MPRTAKAALAALLLVCASAPRGAGAVSLDLSLEYRARALSYQDVALDPVRTGSDAFISERARVGFLVKKIALETVEGVESTMEVGLVLQALDVAGSTAPIPAPFSRAAARYPRTDFTPFLENAYLRVFRVMGSPWELTVGRQPALLGSGLVLSDDGFGFTGLAARRPLERWGAQAFYYQPRATGTGGADRVHLAGAALDFKSDGTLTFYEVLEADHASPVESGVRLRSAVRHFPGLRYQVRNDQFAFEGEGALQRGSAEPAAAGAKNISYRGAAASLSGLWRQDLGRFGSGMARLSVAEGSGDNPSTAGKNEGFFPSFGHRFDGLERDGWGDFFGASLYDAIGPSTTTANGLPAGVSGIRVVRLGVTPPDYRGIRLDLDFLRFEASQAPASREIGHEYDLRLSYAVKDRLLFRLTGAFFSAGKALSAKHASARRIGLEVSGRF